MANRIENYALIGDLQTAALCKNDGSIDWLCWPRFDSGACFAALLGNSDNGCWKIAPADAVEKISRRYRDRTLILETEFHTAEGTVVVTDFMPLRGHHSHIVRIVRGTRGFVRMHMDLILRFDYGQSVPWVTRLDDGTIRAIAGPDMVVLRTPVELRGENLKTVSDFTVAEGQVIPFVLSYCASYANLPEAVDAAKALAATQNFWLKWTARSPATGPWTEAVTRSLITLKALTYLPTGGIVAAPTTSLPEQAGGERNWDYRFCWLRDATFSLQALMHAGYDEEASAWQGWLLRAVAGSPDQAQIMYGVAGEKRLNEWTIPELAGFNGARPVRIGNAASTQLQLDVYGEVADAALHSRQAGLPQNEAAAGVQNIVLEHLEKIWREPDQGIWEVRGPKRHFTHSKVMAWVAFDRGIKSIEQFGLDGPAEHWKEIRDVIHEEVCREGFDPKVGSFVQSYGAKDVDASLLMLPLVGFLPIDDPRIAGTIAKIERDLMCDGLVQRYDTRTTADGLPTGEGVFLACSFWLADIYILQGRTKEAEDLFERLVAMCNDVGLLAEEYDPKAKRQMGNFPQAFSHVALINTALNLSKPHGPAAERSQKGRKVSRS